MLQEEYLKIMLTLICFSVFLFAISYLCRFMYRLSKNILGKNQK